MQLWRTLNRELWPRRYTAWLTAIVVGGFTVVQLWRLSGSWAAVRTSDLAWVAFFGWVACSTLLEATTGLFSKAVRRRYFSRRQAGLCGKCGYDLRAATSVVCPECGAWHGTIPAKRFGRNQSDP